MESCHIRLGVAPLSSCELELALAAICKAWQSPSCVRRQPCQGAWMLGVEHEIVRTPEESGLWLAEKLAATIWQAIGRFARITLILDFCGQSDAELHVLEESDYARILRAFRFGVSR